LVIFISRQAFEQLVEKALDELPKQFAELLTNVAVVVEEEPTEEDLDLLDESDHELLGIYRGTPLPERSFGMPLMPDQIAIFRGPILRICRSRHEAKQEIRDTVIHELGHYFGLDDDEMVY